MIVIGEAEQRREHFAAACPREQEARPSVRSCRTRRPRPRRERGAHGQLAFPLGHANQQGIRNRGTRNDNKSSETAATKRMEGRAWPADPIRNGLDLREPGVATGPLAGPEILALAASNDTPGREAATAPLNSIQFSWEASSTWFHGHMAHTSVSSDR